MNGLLEQAFADAKAAPKATGAVQSLPLMPIVHELKGKGYSLDKIYDFLKERKIRVQENRSTFRASISRRYKTWVKTLSRESAQ